ncbi:hypothetical protein LTR36_006435 [Oleoguttula mirabilis]|uniref:BTB domain-containing protein n=1 Tax=Oleoguttula mirabilis TaxID=1507867 RepID=A0AAV9JV15_9PEZI|nr:hypothetical protein LTR36_006435 [Oleoguttula mirabilis]
MADIDFTRAFRVLVGPEKQAFTVHHDIINRRSAFFRAASSERWTSVEKVIELPDDKSQVFARYLQCLYNNKTWFDDLSQPRGMTGEGDFDLRANRTILRLVHAYILADKLQDLKSCNLIIDRLIHDSDELQRIPNNYALNLIYNQTPKASPLRKLVVDFLVYEANAENDSYNMEDAPIEFLQEVIREDARLKNENARERVEDVFAQKVSELGKCRAHQHDASHAVCE